MSRLLRVSVQDAVCHVTSRGNERKTGDAIQETSAAFWLVAGGIVARCALVDP